MTPTPEHARPTRVIAIGLAGAGLLAIGCRTQPAPTGVPPHPALRRIEPPPGGTPADADRAALARFVGVWAFDGWAQDPGGPRREASGHAAGTIEHEHFVLLELAADTGELSGRAGRASGSLMLASEPGIGLTLTAWGDASPSINRLFGDAQGAGAAFTFTEASTPAGRHRLGVTFTFETDDRWTAELRDSSAPGRPIVARYTFRRTVP